MAIYDIDNLPSKFQKEDIINCPYKGSIKSIELPKGQYKLECWGGKGGIGLEIIPTYSVAGNGGYSSGIYTITTSTILYLVSGNKGADGTDTSTHIGGYNGGGQSNCYAGGGGGATHIATRFGLLSELSSYTDEILLVAGGGGGAGYDGDDYAGSGGNGGGSTGADGTNWGTTAIYYGTGASQNTPGYSPYNNRCIGSFGTGGKGYDGIGVTSSSYSAAGGGAGYYGGGGGWRCSAGGGGGSGYISSSLTEASTIQETTSTNPDTTNYAGYIRITVLNVMYSEGIYIKTNNSWMKTSKIFIKSNNTWIE